MRWQFYRGAERSTYASGSELSGVLSLAFLTWLDGRDVNDISDTAGLAGFLAHHSDLSRRELAGLLGTFHFPFPTEDDEFDFRHKDEQIRIVREAPQAEAGVSQFGT
jgi:hypothetical protein